MSAPSALSTFLRHTRDVVIEFDPRVHITAWNPAAERVFGWTANEAVGRDGIELLVRDPAYRARARELMEALLPGRAVEDRIRLVDRDGSVRHLLVDVIHQGDAIVMIGSVLGAPPSAEHGLGSRADAPPDVELPEALQLERLPLVASGVSHDLANLLAVVSTGLEVARRRLRQGQDPEPALDETLAAVERATELNRRLATIARGTLPSRRVMELTPVVHRTASFSLLGRATQLAFRTPEALWPVEADACQISQVVQNLVTNASDAMDRGGAVLVELSNVENPPDTDERFLDGPHVVLRVIDRGAGIPEALRRRIFDPFFSTKPHGSGLGLSTSASIVRAHHGFLRVLSTAGGGSTFEVWLPALPSAESAPPVAP